MDDVFDVGAPPAEPEGEGLTDAFAAPPAEADFSAEPMPSFEAPTDMGAFEAPAEVPMFEAPPAEMPSFEAPPPDMGGMGGMAMGNEFMAPGELGPLAQWRIEQQEKVAAKQAASDAAMQTRLAEAQEALSNFYAQRTDITTKRAAANREEEASYVQARDAAMIADSWESVCKLVDMKGPEKGKETPDKDTSRMRGLLVQLKHT